MSENIRIALTGGIACGKSLLSRFLNDLGVETLDADDVAHEIIPDPAERRRIASEVFANPTKRRELESRIHPLVKKRICEWLSTANDDAKIRIAVIPLLFETHWDAEYDIICSVISSPERQVERMMTTRGYSRVEAEARLAAQLPVGKKVAGSHYVIRNDGSAEDLRQAACEFVHWLRSKVQQTVK